MVIEYDDGGMTVGYGNVRKIICTWTSDASAGTVTGTTSKISGTLIRAVTDPAAAGAAPSDNYDIVLTDETGADVLGSCKKGLIDRDTSNTEEVYFQVLNTDTSPLSTSQQPVVCDKLTVSITNAGNSKQGVLYLYFKPL